MEKLNIGVIIPAHNEAMTISDCLTAIKKAMAQLPATISARPLVVLDSCTDDTAALVEAAGVASLTCDYRCVGQARDLGARHAIQSGATWLACTDADSLVATNWLTEQVSHLTYQPTAMICGVVSIDSWAHLTSQTKEAYTAHYQDMMDHRHIHGANLSFTAEAYQAVGGFAALPCHEDVDLVNKFDSQGYNIIWSNRVRVTTSSRLNARASEGFAAFLANLETNHRT
ncbi:glycosyltransferase [Psychrobacter celer]|uniref:glycosyltransferase n=1 Tax=Psychrobacter celer TaxID=306572 RepID=UPI003FD38B78